MVGPEMSRVKDLVAEDGVPMIQLKTSLRGDLEVEAVRCASYRRYTAMSYVVSIKQD